MRKLGLFFVGGLSVIALTLVVGGIFLMSAHGFSAREQTSPLERWAARRARQFALPADAR